MRIVTAGLPRIPGTTMLAKRKWAREHLEAYRGALIAEPRGHSDMYGCFLTEAVELRFPKRIRKSPLQTL